MAVDEQVDRAGEHPPAGREDAGPPPLAVLDRAAAERIEELWNGLAPAAAEAARLAAGVSEPVRQAARDAAGRAAAGAERRTGALRARVRPGEPEEAPGEEPAPAEERV
ncbi:hypothetical protein [Spirillospora sp. NPDC029432]|uniref:hypothetical protein n=1 Tax=Spirillospora sp. NPDC029432 TaxID=3154599 RepID=UPI003454067D